MHFGINQSPDENRTVIQTGLIRAAADDCMSSSASTAL